METTFDIPNYVTTFEIGQDSEGNWKAWIEFNGKITKERYCLNKEHAERIRTQFVNEFWGNKLN